MSDNFQAEPPRRSPRDVPDSEGLHDFSLRRHQSNSGSAWLGVGVGIVLLLGFGGVFLVGGFLWFLIPVAAPMPVASAPPAVAPAPPALVADVPAPPLALDQKEAVAQIRRRGGWVQFNKGEVRKIAFDDKTTDDDLEALKFFPKVRWLSLSNTGVTDEGLKQLLGLADLSELDLENTKVTDEGVRQLRQALPKVRITR